MNIPILIVLGLVVAFAAMAEGKLPYAIAGMVGTAAIVAAIRRPIHLVGMTLLATVPAAIDLTGQTFVTPYKLALILLFFATGLLLARRRTVMTLPFDTSVLLGIVAIAMLLRDIEASRGAPLMIEIAGVAMLLFATSQLVHGPKQAIQLGLTAFVGVLFSGAWCVIEKPPWTLLGGITRALGPAGDPNSSATMQLLLMFIALPWLTRLPTTLRLIGRAMLGAATVYCIFATASRGATLAGVVGVAVFAMLLPRRLSISLRNLFVAGCLVALALAFAPSSFVLRIGNTVQSDEAGNTVVEDSHRGEINALALSMVETAPLFGQGSDVFLEVAAQKIGLTNVVHNAPLRVAVAYGIPIAFLYTLIFLLPMVRGIQLLRIHSEVPRDLTAALMSASVTAFAFIQTNPRLFRALFIFVGMLLTLLHQRSVAHGRRKIEPQVAIGPHLASPMIERG